MSTAKKELLGEGLSSSLKKSRDRYKAPAKPSKKASMRYFPDSTSTIFQS